MPFRSMPAHGSGAMSTATNFAPLAVGRVDGLTAKISLAAQRKAVIVISSYLPEILTVADRIVEEMPRAEATEEKIMYAAIH